MRRAMTLAALLAACVLVARADTIVLRDGSVREGKIVGETKDGYELEIARGRLTAVITIPKADVAEVKRGATENERLVAEYEKRRKALKPGDTKGWAELAAWCESRVGFSREAREAFRKVIAAAPDHEVARRKLGFVKVGGAWLTEDEIMRAKGYVRHAGEWVTPEERRRLAGSVRIEPSANEVEHETWQRAAAGAVPAGVILPPVPYYPDSLLYRTYGAYPYYSGSYVGPGVWVGTVGTCWPYSTYTSTTRSSGSSVGFGFRWSGTRGDTGWNVGWGTNFGGGGGTFGGITITHND